MTKPTVAYERPFGGRSATARAASLLRDFLGQKRYTRRHPVYMQGAKGAPAVAREGAPTAIASMHEWVRAFPEIVGPASVSFLLNGAKKSAAPLPEEFASLRAEFPGSQIARGSVEDPGTAAGAIRSRGALLVDACIARHPLSEADLEPAPHTL